MHAGHYSSKLVCVGGEVHRLIQASEVQMQELKLF